jgi:hypothetical protein
LGLADAGEVTLGEQGDVPVGRAVVAPDGEGGDDLDPARLVDEVQHLGPVGVGHLDHEELVAGRRLNEGRAAAGQPAAVDLVREDALGVPERRRRDSLPDGDAVRVDAGRLKCPADRLGRHRGVEHLDGAGRLGPGRDTHVDRSQVQLARDVRRQPVRLAGRDGHVGCRVADEAGPQSGAAGELQPVAELRRIAADRVPVVVPRRLPADAGDEQREAADHDEDDQQADPPVLAEVHRVTPSYLYQRSRLRLSR